MGQFPTPGITKELEDFLDQFYQQWQPEFFRAPEMAILRAQANVVVWSHTHAKALTAVTLSFVVEVESCSSRPGGVQEPKTKQQQQAGRARPILTSKNDRMISSPSDSQSESSSGSSSPAEVIRPEQMMDWKEWEGCMRKIQSRGLTRFLNRYVVNKRTDIQKFLVNLESIVINEQSTDDDEDKNLDKIQALVRLENSILKFLKARKKSPEYNSIDDAVSLIQRAEKILILTGAGISTSCGIPDFRSENGLYSQLEDYEGLDDPHDMFAQNIDTLEMRAGVKNLIQCHGSFAKFTCLKCRAKYPASEFEDSIARGRVVLCPICSSKAEETSKMEASKKAVPSHKRRKVESAYRFDAVSSDDDPDIDWVDLGLMKPDIIFFKSLNNDFLFICLPLYNGSILQSDRFECDLVIVIGTSLKVAPVSEIIKYVPDGVPQILINRDPIYHGRRKTAQTQGEGKFEYEGDEFEFDICLFGQSDLILRELSRRLGPGWQLDQPSSIPGVPSTQNNSLANPLSGQQEQQQDISINEGHKPISSPSSANMSTISGSFPVLTSPILGSIDGGYSTELVATPAMEIKILVAPKSQTLNRPIKLLNLLLLKKIRENSKPEPINHPNVTGNRPLIDIPSVHGLHQDTLAPGNSQAQAPSRNETTGPIITHQAKQ
ncbi:hypothetical protein PSTT_13430, partial [Puccinia striiformis]